MRWRALLVAVVTIWVVVGAGEVGAQSTLGAPTVGAITATMNTLTVPWSAPADDGGSAITAYEVRYIRTDASGKTVDANWTAWITGGGTLVYELKNLLDGVEYDVAVRAENANGDVGPWATTTGTTTDHGDTTATATALALSSSLPGSLDPADDEDVFSIVLTSAADLWVYTTGDTPTVGKLLNSSGAELKEALSTTLLDAPRGFALRSELSAGTYYVRVGSYRAGEAGSYTIHAQTVTDPGNTIATATPVTLDSATPGRIGPEAGGSVDKDVYQLVLNARTDIWVMAIGEHEGAGDAGPLDTMGDLLDSAGSQLARSDDSKFPNNEEGFMLRRTLLAGTYYIRVQGFASRHIGPYTLHVRTAAEPGSTTATAAPLTLRVPETGRISSRSDRDYFSLTLAEETYVFMVALTFGNSLRLTPTILDDEGNTVTAHIATQADYAGQGRREVSFTVWARLDAGTYHLRVRPTGSATGRYLLAPLVSADTAVAQRCTGITTAQSDPWYGCQWHLKNSGQFGSGALQDINVESVWTGGNMGAGVNVVVVDDGLHSGHEDLTDNVLTARNHDYAGQGGVYDALSTHGTSVAGIIAARDNDLGVRGVAPRAKIFAYNAAARGISSDHEANAMFRGEDADHIAVSSNSWGFRDTGSPNNAQSAWERAVERGVTEGYGGKGIFYVWGAGNGHVSRDDNSNLDGRANFHAVTAVCAIGYDDVRSSYSEMGANLWVCAPSNSGREGLPGIATTRTGSRYRDDFGGTSAAVPIVSGVAALVRAANTSLTWRAVKLILAASARRNDTGNSGWQEGALEYGSATDRYRFNHEYGFGAVDAAAAVALAVDDRWADLPSQRSTEASSGSLGDPPGTGLAILDGAITTSSVTLDHHVGFVEFMQIEVELTHEWFRDLRIELVSPAGNVSVLSVPSSMAGPSLFSTARFEGTHRFGSAKHLGESAAGAWTLFISDHQFGDSGVLKSWKLKAYGHGHTPGYPSITTVDPGRGSFDVTWSAPDDIGGSDITSYDIGYILTDDPDSTNWTEVTNVGSTSALQHTLSGLKGDAEFHLAVRAVNDAGAGPWSDSFTEETEQSVPNRPRSVVAAARDGGLAVSWRAPSYLGVGSPTSYDVRYIRNDASDKADALWTTTSPAWATGGGDLRYVIRGLDNGVLYDVQVLARNDAGPGEWSGVTTGTPAAINSPAEFPNIEAGLRSVLESTPAGVDIGEPVAARDDESDTLTYSLASGGATFEIVATTGQLRTKARLDHETAPTHVLIVNVSDGKDSNGDADSAIDDTISVTITVSDVEETPEFPSSSTTRRVDEDLAVGQNVGAPVVASDGDRDTLSYSLATLSSVFEIVASSGQLRTKARLDHETAPTHVLVVNVSDRKDADGEPVAETVPDIDDTVIVTITVTDVDEPAELSLAATGGVRANANALSVDEHYEGTLATFSARDPEQQAGLTYEWSVGGTDRLDFVISAAGVLSFAATPDYERPADSGGNNVYEITVNALDSGGKTGRSAVTVTVGPVSEPPLISGPASVDDYPENSSTSRRAGRYTATDPEGAGVTWSALSGRDADAFELSNAGALTFRVSPDYEEQTEYRVRLNAYDGDLTGRLDVTVTIADVNEPPVVARSSGAGAFSIEEHSGTAVGSFTATDPERDAVTWSLAQSGDHRRFAIGASDGVLSLKEAPDYERNDLGADKAYHVTVRASEQDDADPLTRELTGSLPVTVRVTDVNEAPTVTGNLTPGVRENTTAVATYSASDPERVTITWSLPGAGADDFTISGGGALAFKNAPDYEARTRHSVTVRASDGRHDIDRDVTVAVTDVDEREELVLSERRPLIGIAYTAAFEEGTGDAVQSPMWAWARSTSETGGFTTISGASAATYLPTGADRDHYLRVSASYDDGHGTKTLSKVSDFVTQPHSTTNTAPAFPSPLFTGGVTGLSVRENATMGTLVGTGPQATDAQNDPLRYSLAVAGFTSGPPFGINAVSRQIRVAAGAALNHEARDTYSVTVTAEDDFNATATATFEITIEDVNEPPMAVADPSVTTAEDTPVTFEVLANDSDPDEGDTLSVQITSQPRRGRAGVDAATQRLTYTPAEHDHGTYTFSYTASDGSLTSTRALVTVTVTSVNDPPRFAAGTTARSVSESAGPGDPVGAAVTATDVDHPDLSYRLAGAPDFVVDGATGQIRVAPGVALDREDTPSYTATVTASDELGATDSTIVTITLDNVNDPPVAANDTATTDEDRPLSIDVLANDSDPDTEHAKLRASVLTQPLNGRARVESDRTISYTPDANVSGPDSFTYRVSDGALSDDGTVTVTVNAVNDAPEFPAPTAARSVPASAGAGDNVGAPVTATDVDEGDTLVYSLSGTDAASFGIDAGSGQITVATFDVATRDTYTVTVEADDGNGGRATIEVTMTVTTGPVGPVIIGGGGGGGPSGPTPSELDFEWTVKHDIDELDGAHDKPSGMWSDGTTLWLLENGDGADDAVYAYDLESGERLEEREFELAERNRAPRGIWFGRETVWVADSGRERLFAYDLETGERDEEREVVLAERNRDARGLWSDGTTIWVLDGGKDSLFVYDLASGELLAEYALDDANGDPHGIWSDGVSVWVSNHDPKRIFAYRLPVLDGDAVEDGDALPLERVHAEEFGGSRELTKASNNSPRGLWSDGDVMYVADASDDKVYTYNMPDAIDARLASLTLSGVDIGEFSSGRTEYESTVTAGVTLTTVAAAAEQRGATVAIDPADADEDAEGHQIALAGVEEIAVTVTSSDGSRERVYRVRVAEAEAAGPSASCLRGAVNPGFSLVASEGGSVEDLAACAESRNVTALYVLVEGAWVSYILGAPGFVNEDFAGLYPDGLPALTPLVVRSEGPASPAPVAPVVAEPFAVCLRGEIDAGFNLVVYAGGSVDDLVTCADHRDIAALYVLDDGVWVSYILGAPEFVNEAFVTLFAGAVPAATPLVARSD